jgi:RNA-directed DNA polymerase
MNETSGSVPTHLNATRTDSDAGAALRDQPLTTLAHHIDLSGCARHTDARARTVQRAWTDRPRTVRGNLEDNLRSLLERAKSGTYRAPPVRRVYIPKGKGEMRPLGIPTFEDKVLQRAVAMVLEAVYEQEFFDCSYGFRPGRSAHQALDVLHGEAMRMSGGWVIELDIRKYFDTIDHEQLREVLRRRVRDGVMQRLIGKWLHAGVMEGRRGERSRKRAVRRAASSRRSWRTSSCIRCSTCGLPRRCARACAVALIWCATRTTP